VNSRTTAYASSCRCRPGPRERYSHTTRVWVVEIPPFFSARRKLRIDWETPCSHGSRGEVIPDGIEKKPPGVNLRSFVVVEEYDMRLVGPLSR
jgi:hypothetical protein